MVNVANITLETDKIKACLFNLVIFCDEGSRLGYFHSLIQAVIERFPCRITFIHSDMKDTSDSLRLKQSVVKAEEGEHITECDMLDIYASASRIERVPFVAIPYLVADLPIFILWGQDLAKDHTILSDINKFADRIIVDSESTDDLSTFSRSILDTVHKEHIELVDLNWARMSGWRDVISKVFNTQKRLETLEAAEGIEIVYNGLENSFFHHSETQAIYLQSWLAEKLGWKFVSLNRQEGTSEVVYTKEQGQVSISLKPGQFQERAPGSIFSFYLRTPHGSEISINRKQQSRQVVVHLASSEICQLPFHLYLQGTQHNFALFREIFYSQTHKSYCSMLEVLANQGWSG